MSELQESVIREKTLVMLARNQGNKQITKRIIKQFLKCIRE
ncbi:MAG: hypothetical protein CM15mV56_430 [uncultured marine virus]|jgi:hypothetical protein|nr:MAG: hypothetical protein CM15mV56_430 [uncultured marine virus]